MKDRLQLAAEILGVSIDACKDEIRYAYYKLMLAYHPDKNKNDPENNRKSALVIEAKDTLLGKEFNPTMLKDSQLVYEVINHTVCDEHVMCYQEWLKAQFYNMENGSIWPC